MVDAVVRHTFLLVLLCSGIPLLVSAVSGFVVSVFQASTQIQDQTISYVVKLAAVSATIVMMWGWFSRQLVDLFRELISSIGFLGGM